jgi:hypothetical protein
MNTKPKIDKEKFKKIFREHWEDFKRKYARYRDPYYDEVIKKMINCGEEKSGYSVYVCIECGGEEKKWLLVAKAAFVCLAGRCIQIIGRVI